MNAMLYLLPRFVIVMRGTHFPRGMSMKMYAPSSSSMVSFRRTPAFSMWLMSWATFGNLSIMVFRATVLFQSILGARFVGFFVHAAFARVAFAPVTSNLPLRMAPCEMRALGYFLVPTVTLAKMSAAFVMFEIVPVMGFPRGRRTVTRWPIDSFFMAPMVPPIPSTSKCASMIERINPPEDLIFMRTSPGVFVQPQGRPRRVKLSVRFGWERGSNKADDGTMMAHWVIRPVHAAWFPEVRQAMAEVFPEYEQLAIYHGWFWDGPWYYIENSVHFWTEYLVSANLRPDLKFDRIYYSGYRGPDLDVARMAYDNFRNASAYGRLRSDREDPILMDASPEYVENYLISRKGDLLELFRHETTESLLRRFPSEKAPKRRRR